MSQPATRTIEPLIHLQESQSSAEIALESRRIRCLQLVIEVVAKAIREDRNLPVEQASQMVANTRRLALSMFPDKTLAYDLIFRPRLQRLMRERYRMQ